MPKEKMSLDELLARQESPASLATVEPVKDDPGSVKVTPWAPNGGCQCYLALTVPKGPSSQSRRPRGGTTAATRCSTW